MTRGLSSRLSKALHAERPSMSAADIISSCRFKNPQHQQLQI